ncbi:sugar porter family MFS transporter [Saccharopolyspora sp. K220]|uniref:sugar porter family MFS transporter n=1 Tax=Saccharopolyspora soli TaxID=2926618 RepID=UPI001F5833F5|nr:sugar porter family MFS transporter [Saccharopolyspora soli]MCI2422545.1 sugar porter family MFS transporter [Saccharopolyspora soli]
MTRQRLFVLAVSAISALGGMLFGYDIGVISGALLFLADDFGLGPFLQGVVTSSLLVGAAVGALVGGRLADRFGRRAVLVAAATVFMLGALGSAFAPDTWTLIGSRFVLGLAVGAASLVVPLYIAEMTPAANRGALVSVNQLMVTVGILLSYLVNSAFAEAHAWRWMLGLAVLPAILLGIGMLLLPDTPRWFLSNGHHAQAKAVLRRSRPAHVVEAELTEITQVLAQERHVASGRSALTERRVRPMLVVGVGLAIIQQITGINTIIYFAPSILRATGFGTSGAILSTVGVGVVNVALTVVAIGLVDRLGRRPLVLIGLAGMALSAALLGAVYLLPDLSGAAGYAALIAIAAYVACYAVSLGPVVWLMISEIYPLRIRGSAMSVSTIALWLTNVLVALTFLSMFAALGGTATFWIYAGVCVAAWLFTYFLVPETKQRTLEQIEADLQMSR